MFLRFVGQQSNGLCLPPLGLLEVAAFGIRRSERVENPGALSAVDVVGSLGVLNCLATVAEAGVRTSRLQPRQIAAGDGVVGMSSNRLVVLDNAAVILILERASGRFIATWGLRCIASL